jgi:alkylation response protein AidB-like acyl-CoA dehydrogenase
MCIHAHSPDADPERLDPHEQKFVQRIREHGWLGMHVTPDDNGPGFSHTTGFWLKGRRFRR